MHMTNSTFKSLLKKKRKETLDGFSGEFYKTLKKEIRPEDGSRANTS